MTLTGLGERVHLAHVGIDLETHVADVVDLLECNVLEDVVLVGHSYSGIVVTAPARASMVSECSGRLNAHASVNPRSGMP